jgi:prepilin-type N-terminal cleavage/methylation domain-containing protein
MARRAFTLVELSVAMLVAAVVLVAAFQAISVMARTQKSADVKASRALLEAQLLESLLEDLRSRAGPPTPQGAFTRFDRYVVQGGTLVTHKVTWTREGNTRIVRDEDGRKREFDFTGLLDADVREVEFKLEASPGEFMSQGPAGR